MEFIQSISRMFGNIDIQTKALVASTILTIILGLIVVPILRKKKIGQVVRDDGPQSHLKKTGTPTMGGIIMLAAILVVSIVFGLKYPKIFPLVGVTIGFGVIGFIDDFKKLILKNPKGLSPKLKMAGLIIVSIGFAVYLLLSNFGTDIYIPFAKSYIILPKIIYALFVVLVMIACTNSVNLTDGLDGLAAGVSSIILIFFIYVSMAWGDKVNSVFSAIVAGASIGFLFFNINPAKVFMGDTGS
jgi:phospho-N-acetylmuramoyl-pentapeptide-transferase